MHPAMWFTVVPLNLRHPEAPTMGTARHVFVHMTFAWPDALTFEFSHALSYTDWSGQTRLVPNADEHCQRRSGVEPMDVHFIEVCGKEETRSRCCFQGPVLTCTGSQADLPKPLVRLSASEKAKLIRRRYRLDESREGRERRQMRWYHFEYIQNRFLCITHAP